MLTFFGVGIFGVGIFVGAVGAAAPEVMLDILLRQDPEYVALDDAARERARKGARVFGVFLFLIGVLGLCTVLAGDRGATPIGESEPLSAQDSIGQARSFLCPDLAKRGCRRSVQKEG